MQSTLPNQSPTLGAESDAGERHGQSDRRDRPGREAKLRGVVDDAIRDSGDHDRRIASAPARLKLRTANGAPILEPGVFRIMVGSSSKDIRLRGELTVQ